MANVHGGAERIGLHTADLLATAFESKCFLNRALKPHTALLTEDSVIWMKIPGSVVKISRNPLAILYYLLASIWLVIKHRPERGAVFYCNDLESVIMAAAAKIICKARIIWHVHDVYKLEKRSTRMVLALVARITNVLVCLTGRNAERMASIFPCRIEVVPNFCRLEPLEGARSRVFQQNGEIVFGCLGQITRWKRIDAAIRLVKALNVEHGVRCRLKIGGSALYDSDRQYQEELHQLSRDTNYVEWIGPVEDAATFFDGIDFLVSFSDNEPFGLVILEALSQGVPVISSDGDGPRQLLTDEVGLILAEGVHSVKHVRHYVTSLEASSYAKKSFACTKQASLYSVELFSNRICHEVGQLFMN